MKLDLLMILPQIITLTAAIVALIFEMLRQPKGSLWTVVAGMLVAAAISFDRLPVSTSAFSGTFRIDALSSWATIILCPATILFSLLARAELKGAEREGTVYSLLVFSTLGALLLAGAGDMMFIVLGILISGLSGFALVAHPKTDQATEGAMKYFIYGAVAGALMVFGLTYWVGFTGDTTLSSLNDQAAPTLPLIMGFAGLVIGVSYAASVFPFHFWTPDAFEGAPVSVAAFLSVTPKIGALFALAQVVKDIPLNLEWRLAIAILSVLSMTFGNVLALRQNNLIRLLAYSTIAQAGYFLLGIIAVNRGELAVHALVVFAAAYAAMNTGAFAYVQQYAKHIGQLDGLGKIMPFTAVAMAVFLFSLVGIPPLAGFAAKLLLFGAAIESGYTWLAIAAIINSVISLAVYLRIVSPLFFRQPSRQPRPLSVHAGFVIVFCLIAVAALGIGVEWLIGH